MIKEEFSFLSTDGETTIHGVSWMPEKEVVAVLQICHGMVEYIERYEPFAEYLTERGFFVVGHDHLGHGKSVLSEDKLGFFHDKDGNHCLIEDIHQVRSAVQETNPGFPYFIMGHSMGSFLVRQYLTEHGNGLDGAIIMGTGHHSMPELVAGRLLCRIIAAVKGWDYRSSFVKKMAMGSFNKHFQPEKTGAEWLSRDEEITGAYAKDPLCSFDFTINAYFHMFGGMMKLMHTSSIRKIPVNLPVLFVAGREDPVGNMGKSVIKVYNAYKKNNIQDVKIKLYKDDRHEILNELDRENVYDDIYRWMEKRLGNRDLDVMRILAAEDEEESRDAVCSEGSSSEENGGE